MLIHIIMHLLLVKNTWMSIVWIKVRVLHVVLVVIVVGVVVLAVKLVVLLFKLAAILVDIVVITFLTKNIN